MEVFPGIHRIKTEFDGVNLFVHLLRDERSMLIDCGVSSAVEQTILPYLGDISEPVYLDWIIITHAHVDHFGGAYALKQALPQAKLMVHSSDADWVEDHERHLREFCERFDEGYDIPVDQEHKAWLRSLLGKEAVVDTRLNGGEKIRLNERWEVKVIHTPGHSEGNLVIYDPTHRCAFCGEAVQGKGIEVSGEIAHPPLYVNVTDYLGTISRIRELSLEYLFDAHRPVLKGAEIEEFLDESESFVIHIDRTIRKFLEESRKPATLKEITESISQILGPYQSPVIAKTTVHAHLDHLVKEKKARLHQLDEIFAWQVA